MPPPYVLIGKKKIPCQSIDVSMVDRGVLMLIFHDHTDYVPWPQKGFSFYEAKASPAATQVYMTPSIASNVRTMDLDGRELFARYGNVPPADTEVTRLSEIEAHKASMSRTLASLTAMPRGMQPVDVEPPEE